MSYIYHVYREAVKSICPCPFVPKKEDNTHPAITNAPKTKPLS